MERRVAQRERTDGTGSISIDEHSSVGCIVYDVSENGIRVTLPDAEIVPTVFVCKGRTNSRPLWRSKTRPVAACSLNDEGARSGPFIVYRRP